ncbi:hypothetical protein EZJ43_12780 [Pedobacter changchengzhani]|uniref:DUF5018 domain-containing protein n=1 Tax=Pedobacter changchengzhani TaxID=2529274 RepID=A0A4R5MJW4_9SPHI|nr:hypothetical protein [Pedobacter changchengzhani]TDG35495.1 hypothetical protein EZJ43_12780 [Pedobacter changchengzhani]
MKAPSYLFIALLFFISCKKDPSKIDGEKNNKSSEKKITSFKLTNFKPESVGNINESEKKIVLRVIATSVNINSLTSVISISDKATISSENTKDGTNSSSHSLPYSTSYVVTAEDGSTATYNVVIDSYVQPGTPVYN